MATAILIGFVAASSVGCLPLPHPRDAPKEECAREFHLWSNDQPLGPSDEFLRVAREIAATPGAVTDLDKVSRRAGWSGRWDRVVVVGGSTSSADLNELAGTTGICFDGFNGGDSDSGFNGHYVFFDGPHPKQAAGAGSRPVIDTDGHPLVWRHDPLVSDTSLETPVLRLVTAETQ
ncbi:hypothetical protein [Gordonia sp. NPDC058843]|uniref:hypothetical protein n=1 Tax=Gordonia sp. NPDC058843 TaxID=3346648 RepID=UPI003691427D